uniref:Malectin domain-containing carbohydrate-binding protein n=1 Tax=Desertifilum tharense IPPAS B-1220 TaxID=1781255 RepID=A0ACD5H239_9CYAN
MQRLWGYNHLVTTVKNADGTTGALSPVQILKLDPTATPTPTPVPTPTPTPAPIPISDAIRINAGGEQYTDSLGQVWLADTFFQGGSIYKTTQPISATVEDPIYQTERFGKSFSYAIPVKNGVYDINLALAEIYFSAPNLRVFSVKAEGNQVVSNLDVFAKAGNYKVPCDSYRKRYR